MIRIKLFSVAIALLLIGCSGASIIFTDLDCNESLVIVWENQDCPINEDLPL